MKKIIRQIFIISLIIIMIAMIIPPSTSKASVGQVVDGIAGILLYPIKAVIILLGDIILEILNFSVGGQSGNLSITDILFNQEKPDSGTASARLPILNVNFFDDLTAKGTSDNTANALREGIQTWYVSMRNIAIVLLAIICIYVGMRMALATVAEQQAKYKQMLIDWLTSLGLVFVMHYIMIFIIEINDSLVNVIATAFKNSNGNGSQLNDLSNNIRDSAFSSVTFSSGVAYTIAYLALAAEILVFFLTYLKRMVTVAFLVIIAPLVTVTYSIDKMNDGKSQALSTWLKEFAYNVLIQPFNCIAYAALGGIALNIIGDGSSGTSISAIIIALYLIYFIIPSEEIVKHIFGFQSASMARAIGQTAFAMSIFGTGAKVNSAINSGMKNKFTDIQTKHQNKRLMNNNNGGEKNIAGETNNNNNNNIIRQQQLGAGQNSGQPQGGNSIKRPNKILGALVNGARLYAKGGLVAGKVLTSIGTNIGLQNGKGIVPGVFDAATSQVKTNNMLINPNQQKAKLTTAYRDYQEKMERNGYSADDSRNMAQSLLNGEVIPQNAAEQKLFDSLNNYKRGLSNSGVDDKELLSTASNDLNIIADGGTSEITGAYYFRKRGRPIQAQRQSQDNNRQNESTFNENNSNENNANTTTNNNGRRNERRRNSSPRTSANRGKNPSRQGMPGKSKGQRKSGKNKGQRRRHS